MRVTFDSNVWEKVVYPEGSARDPRQAAFLVIREAVRDRRLQAYIAELFALLEAVPRRNRPEYLGSRPSPVRVTEGRAEGGGVFCHAGTGRAARGPPWAEPDIERPSSGGLAARLSSFAKHSNWYAAAG